MDVTSYSGVDLKMESSSLTLPVIKSWIKVKDSDLVPFDDSIVDLDAILVKLEELAAFHHLELGTFFILLLFFYFLLLFHPSFYFTLFFHPINQPGDGVAEYISVALQERIRFLLEKITRASKCRLGILLL